MGSVPYLALHDIARGKESPRRKVEKEYASGRTATGITLWRKTF
jgi:hypothetical protein